MQDEAAQHICSYCTMGTLKIFIVPHRTCKVSHLEPAKHIVFWPTDWLQNKMYTTHTHYPYTLYICTYVFVINIHNMFLQCVVHLTTTEIHSCVVWMHCVQNEHQFFNQIDIDTFSTHTTCNYYYILCMHPMSNWIKEEFIQLMKMGNYHTCVQLTDKEMSMIPYSTCSIVYIVNSMVCKNDNFSTLQMLLLSIEWPVCVNVTKLSCSNTAFSTHL